MPIFYIGVVYAIGLVQNQMLRCLEKDSIEMQGGRLLSYAISRKVLLLEAENMSIINRHRERDRWTNESVEITDRNPDGTVTNITFYGPLRSGGSFESIDDVSTPNYWDRRKTGEIIMNPVILTKDAIDHDRSDYVIGVHPVWGSRQFCGPVGRLFSTLYERAELPAHAPKVSIAREQALIKAYAKMKAPTCEALVELAEFRKTLRMLTKPLSSAKRLSQKFRDRRAFWHKRTKRKSAKTSNPSVLEAAQATANTWLELRYGWRPLYYGVRDFIEAMKKLKKPDAGQLVARSKLEVSDKEIRKGAAVFFHSGDLHGDIVDEMSTTVSAGVIYTIVDNSYTVWADKLFGLNARNIAGTVWELTPYSWVADMFVGIGDWLEACIPDPSIKVLSNWVTVKTISRMSVTNITHDVLINTPPATWYRPSLPDYVEEYTITTRYVDEELSWTPKLNTNKLQWRQLADLASLAIGKVDTSVLRI